MNRTISIVALFVTAMLVVWFRREAARPIIADPAWVEAEDGVQPMDPYLADWTCWAEQDRYDRGIVRLLEAVKAEAAAG